MIFCKSENRGFTFVELMVVIGIIGVVIAAALVAVSQSQNKAKDRFMAEQFGVIRLDAEGSYKSNDREYGQVCSDTRPLRDQIKSDTKRCRDGRDGYAVSMEKSDGTFYCIDSQRRHPLDNLSTSTLDSSGACQFGNGVDCRCGD